MDSCLMSDFPTLDPAKIPNRLDFIVEGACLHISRALARVSASGRLVRKTLK